jgi:uncharacterized protein
MDDPQLDDDLILEGIVVTVNAAGEANVAPMGPRVDRAVTRLVLRPFKTAVTYRNLKATGCGVFHVTDDVLLLARAAIGELDEMPAMTAVPGFACPRLAEACRWWAFRIRQLDDAAERTTIDCEIVKTGEQRPFLGFNRAKHAVLEAAILATRVGILPAEEIRREMERLAVPVEKTAGKEEREAFQVLRDSLRAKLGA